MLTLWSINYLDVSIVRLKEYRPISVMRCLNFDVSIVRLQFTDLCGCLLLMCINSDISQTNVSHEVFELRCLNSGTKVVQTNVGHEVVKLERLNFET